MTRKQLADRYWALAVGCNEIVHMEIDTIVDYMGVQALIADESIPWGVCADAIQSVNEAVAGAPSAEDLLGSLLGEATP